MEIRTLGRNLQVSAVGLGCMGFSHAYGVPTGREETLQMIRSAYELGYTFFDTAEAYGTQEAPHVNEELVGEALKPIRNHVQIASKFGIRFDLESPQVNHPLIPDARPEVIRASVEASLKRLQTDHIDLYFQHRMDPAIEPETVAEVMAICRQGLLNIPCLLLVNWLVGHYGMIWMQMVLFSAMETDGGDIILCFSRKI